jgi:hypothetical protein
VECRVTPVVLHVHQLTLLRLRKVKGQRVFSSSTFEVRMCGGEL